MEKGENEPGIVGMALRSLWASAQKENARRQPLEEKFLHFAPRGMLGIIALLLAFVIGFVSYTIYRRSETGMSNLLAEKGASLLNVFESALRTGMRGHSSLQLQALLSEISQEPDIEFVAVVMPDGTIIAHSNIDRIGEILRFEGKDINLDRMAYLAPADKAKWRITRVEGKRVFLIYRHFSVGNKSWDKDMPRPTIFLGLEVSPFEITNSQNRSFVAMLSLVTMLVVLCGLLALSLAQRASESRRRQRHAEGEVHRLEAEVRQSEKMAAVGTLAAGVAHEIRNPLSSIKGYATFFLQTSPESSEARKAASVMVAEVDRLNRVITDLLGLSRMDDLKIKPIHIEDVVEHVRRLLRHGAQQKNITVVSRFAPKIPQVAGDMERLSQALLNICLNSIEAMKNGGTLLIAVSGGKKHVCLMTRDTGSGIAPEILTRIFDPYFTTKSAGTGLGLPMAHKIVVAHEGFIDVRSRLAKGDSKGETVFRIYLPVLSGASD